MTTSDQWWASLTVTQKERIATKGKNKGSNGPVEHVTYPACTVWWNSISDERKEAIYQHCTDKHGYLLPEWQEGQSLSY